jgi:hypothetical protein
MVSDQEAQVGSPAGPCRCLEATTSHLSTVSATVLNFERNSQISLKTWSQECSPWTEHLPSMCEALDSNPNTTKKT